MNLEELYISHNGIEEIEGLDNMVSMQGIRCMYQKQPCQSMSLRIWLFSLDLHSV